MSELTREEVEAFRALARMQGRLEEDKIAADWLRLHDIVSGQLLDVDKLYGTVAQHAKDYEQVKAERDFLRAAAGLVVRFANSRWDYAYEFDLAIDKLRAALAAGNETVGG